MDITIKCTEEGAMEIIKKAIEAINKCAGEELAWKISAGSVYVYAETKYYRHEGALDTFFDTLLADYPQLDISASYSYSCRDDYSADWWGSTSISTEKNSDGTKRIKRSSSTYWN